MFELDVLWLYENMLPHDLTGFSGLLQVRLTQNDTSTLYVTAASAGYGGASQGTIVFTPAEGRIFVSIPSDVIEDLRGTFTGGFYDLKLFPTGFAVATDNIRLMKGKVKWDLEVTDVDP